MTSTFVDLRTNNNSSTIGEIIRVARINHKMTIEEVANKLNLSEKEILYMEEFGYIHISYELLELVSKTFDYDLDLLIHYATMQLERELDAVTSIQATPIEKKGNLISVIIN